MAQGTFKAVKILHADNVDSEFRVVIFGRTFTDVQHRHMDSTNCLEFLIFFVLCTILGFCWEQCPICSLFYIVIIRV
ncbi:ORF41 [White spot syndrome virus]|uniref:ORF41 n=1 Tax=White spot syndrome virus TaxID=342409 RepID=A0A2D3I665_9VIRU|nr:ORF41 [White spot syndrome virus]